MAITISVSRRLPFPKSIVWQEISNIERHTLWMSDAVQISFSTPNKTGIGTSFTCLTKIGPIQVQDKIKVTKWEEPNTIAIAHKGIFRGIGEISLTHLSPEYCEITWSESITSPIYLLGDLGLLVAKPVLEKIWRHNLEKLEEVITLSRKT